MIREQINETILELQERQGIRVLYACESGSRAWGFASPDSDYDLRFIYAHASDWYLELQEKKDTIDLMLPNDLDLSGWELMKSLRLFASCNLALNEWLDSPEIYWEEPGFRESLVSHVAAFFNPRKALHHYLSMAKGTAERSFDGNKLKIKKLFYILRPLLACRWVLQKESMPPTQFQSLVDEKLVSTEILRLVEVVQVKKETAVEGEIIEVDRNLLSWIQNELETLVGLEDTLPGSRKPGWDDLNKMMLKWTSL